jgi:hypothetical protein
MNREIKSFVGNNKWSIICIFMDYDSLIVLSTCSKLLYKLFYDNLKSLFPPKQTNDPHWLDIYSKIFISEKFITNKIKCNGFNIKIDLDPEYDLIIATMDKLIYKNIKGNVSVVNLKTNKNKKITTNLVDVQQFKYFEKFNKLICYDSYFKRETDDKKLYFYNLDTLYEYSVNLKCNDVSYDIPFCTSDFGKFIYGTNKINIFDLSVCKNVFQAQLPDNDFRQEFYCNKVLSWNNLIISSFTNRNNSNIISSGIFMLDTRCKSLNELIFFTSSETNIYEQQYMSDLIFSITKDYYDDYYTWFGSTKTENKFYSFATGKVMHANSGHCIGSNDLLFYKSVNDIMCETYNTSKLIYQAKNDPIISIYNNMLSILERQADILYYKADEKLYKLYLIDV